MQDKQFEETPSSPKAIMRNWFYANFEDPAHSCPREDGEYVYIHGGPYEAHDMLESNFGGVFDSDEIEDLAIELSSFSHEWAPVNNTGISARELATLISVDDHSLVFKQAMLDVKEMLGFDVTDPLAKKLYGMLFVNIITSLETYLFDRFLTLVMEDRDLFIRFVETSPHFKKQKLSVADIYKTEKNLDFLVKEQIAGITWHNLVIVKNLYKQTADIDIGNLDDLIPLIDIRHDLVHRNGKTNDGTLRQLQIIEVMECAEKVKELVDSIEEQMDKKGFFGPPFEDIGPLFN